MSQDTVKRLQEHNEGKTTSTKAYMPWIIIHQEEFATLDAARAREKYLKSAAGRRWRKQNLSS
ncbi:GIY-YIG nuclease family protein [Flavobacterium sp. J372]|nr:GIY-YIG nuclease family protein [Flavobacterium sp. J372]